MSRIAFCWDDQKNDGNQKKHGVSFEEAQTVFFDENAIEFYDFEHSQAEERFLMLGLSAKLRILLVCYCLRERNNVIRIITARKATKNEQMNYRGGKI
jgi:uncharacterized protein